MVPRLLALVLAAGRCAEALTDFNEAIALAPDDPDPYLGRGVAEECLKRYADAIQVPPQSPRWCMCKSSQAMGLRQ